MAGTDQMNEMLFMGLILLCAIVVFAVLWALIRKYCPDMPSDEKAPSGAVLEAPAGVVTQEASQQHQLKRMVGDGTTVTQTQLTSEPKTLDPTAEASADRPHGGTTSVERSAKPSMSPTRRLTNAARKASVAVSRAVKKETANMLEALSSGSEAVHAKAVADETEDLPCDNTEPRAADAAPADRRPAPDGSLSPGRRLANAACRMSVAAGPAVKEHTTNILEAPSTNTEVAQAPPKEDSPCGAASEITVQGSKAQPPKLVSPVKDGGIAATDAKAQTNAAVPGEQMPARAASLAATSTDKPKDVQKVKTVGSEKPPEGKDDAKPSQPSTVAGVASPSDGPTTTSGVSGRFEDKASPVSPPGGDTSNRRHASSADHSHADDSALLSREPTSKSAHAHRHRRKSKKKSLADGSTTAGDDVIAKSDVHSGVGKSSTKTPDAADHKANEPESSTQRK
ncbi:uncharacterized protein LOC125759158 [Rhipicephalus sanguineus]|uniref:uncharacterized protein LOC125759158 n=1 Tax=Rhipicephalus sanguineus TaxID=34632 RepID=UPI0020C44360|nr:uncharacterized protein LOC125759158 [Rhipicephalus sanguineus]